jgi:ATP-binding cassette, subfamily B, bacterial
VSSDLARHSWPVDRLGEALGALGRHAGLGVRTAAEVAPPAAVLGGGGARLDRWVEAAAAWIGIEAEPVDVAYPALARLVARAGPALVRLPGPDSDGPRFLALLAGTRRHARVLTPDCRVIRIATGAIRSALCRDAEASVAKDVDRILAEISVRPSRRQGVRAALLGQLLVSARVGDGWLLRSAVDAHPLAQARASGLPRRFAILVALQALGSALWIGSWWLLGWISSTGRPDIGWLLAWLLMLMSSVPCRVAATALGGALAIQAGAILKSRLLVGALSLDLDAARRSGIGRLHGLVLESEVIDQVGLLGGILALSAVPELVLAVPVLALGAGGLPHAALLMVTMVATLWLAWRYGSARGQWTEARLEMTNDLIERMIGHRTRLAQEPHARRHEDEDRALERYLEPSEQLDHLGASLLVLVPRGWLLVGLLGLAPAFMSGNAPPATMAVGLGGVLLAYQALRTLAEAVEGIAAAAIAWGLLRPLLTVTVPRETAGHPDYVVALPPASVPAGRLPRLDARDLGFGYCDRAEPVLRGASLCIGDGARILLRGPSGGGKSTLVALLAGLRASDSGLLLWDGLDLATLGVDGWRQRVALAPQFHENHVLMGTFAFNLLMGRGWPPRPADLEEAEAVCRALALGPLLDRMPSGIHQVLGETGWQLSHGERSRLYLARALLQGADLIILDESFAALDPATLREVFAYVLRKRPALVVVAHP